MIQSKSFTIIVFLIIILTIIVYIFCMIQPIEKMYESNLPSIDYILIKKKERILEIYSNAKYIKRYNIALGFNPIGHKESEGDGKTPEGKYIISAKNPKSKFYLSLKISYPSQKDLLNATIKDINPGGDIMIHGIGKIFGFLGKMHLKKDWTLGCIALTNEEITEIYNSVEIGTVVEIKP